MMDMDRDIEFLSRSRFDGVEGAGEHNISSDVESI